MMQPEFGTDSEHLKLERALQEGRSRPPIAPYRQGRAWGLWLALLLIVGAIGGFLGWRWYHYSYPEPAQILREAAQAALQAEPSERLNLLFGLLGGYMGLMPPSEERALLEQLEALIEQQSQTPMERAQRRLQLAVLWVRFGETARGERIALDTLANAADLAPLEEQTTQFVMALPREQPRAVAEQWVETQSQRFPRLRPLLYQAQWRAAIELDDPEYAEQLMRRRYEPTVERLLQIVELYERDLHYHRSRPLLREAEQLWRKRPTLQQGLQLASIYAYNKDKRADSLLYELARRYPNMSKREWLSIAFLSNQRQLPLYTEAMERVLERPDAQTVQLLIPYAPLFNASPLRERVMEAVETHGAPAQQVEFLLELRQLDAALARAQQLDALYKQPRLMEALVEAGRYDDALRLYGAHPDYIVGVRVAIGHAYLFKHSDPARAHALIAKLPDAQYAQALYALLSIDGIYDTLLQLARHARWAGAERRAPQFEQYVRQVKARVREIELNSHRRYGAVYREARRIKNPAQRADALMAVVSRMFSS